MRNFLKDGRFVAEESQAKSAVASGLPSPPGGDLWPLRPAPEQLDPVTG